MGSARCRFKMLRRVENKLEIKRKVTTASDAWMSILERCFLNPGFWKRDQRRPTPFCVKRRECGRACKHCSGLVAAFPRYATATGTPESHKFSVCTILLCIAVCRPYTRVPGCTCLTYTCTPENSQVPRERPSLLYNHTNVILRMVI